MDLEEKNRIKQYVGFGLIGFWLGLLTFNSVQFINLGYRNMGEFISYFLILTTITIPLGISFLFSSSTSRQNSMYLFSMGLCLIVIGIFVIIDRNLTFDEILRLFQQNTLIALVVGFTYGLGFIGGIFCIITGFVIYFLKNHDLKVVLSIFGCLVFIASFEISFMNLFLKVGSI